MKIRLLFKYLVIFLIPLSMIQPVKADLASDLLKLAGDAAAKNKVEYAKWGLTSSKDIKKLKSKEIKLLLNGNVFDGNFNDNENQGTTEEIYYKDGTYKGTIAGQSETGKWYIKEGKLCYKGYPGCSKIYKSKSEPNVYYQKQQGIIFTKFNKVGSIEEIEKIKKVAKEKKLAKEKVAKEKKLAKEKVAKEKLEKKLSLLPNQTELEKAQNFLNTVKSFVKLNPDEFDIVKVSEFLISIKPISEGNLDDVLKNNLELFKEFTNSSSVFTKHYKTLEEIKINEEVKKIDQTISILEKNIKTIKGFLTNNPDSIYATQWIADMKKANNIRNNAINYKQLVVESERLSDVIKNFMNIYNEKEAKRIAEEKTKEAKRIAEAKTLVEAKFTIIELKENLKLNFTSDLAPLIIEQIKSLEQAIKKVNIQDITSANKVAEEFIFKYFEEPELKAAEEKKIADEKAAEEARIAEETRLKNFKKIRFTCVYETGRGQMDYKMEWMFDGKTVYLAITASVDGITLLTEDTKPLKIGKRLLYPGGDERYYRVLKKKKNLNAFYFITETPQVQNEFFVDFDSNTSFLNTYSHSGGSGVMGVCS